MIRIAFLLFTITLLFSCSGKKPEGIALKFENTHWVQLEREVTRIRVPNGFKRTSRFRLHEDLPVLNKDTFFLRSVENALHMGEFSDEYIDVFVDTTVEFRLCIIYDAELLPFDKETARLLSANLDAQIREIESLNPEMGYEKVDAKLVGNKDLTFLKSKYLVTNYFTGDRLYHTMFIGTTPLRTLTIVEISSQALDLELNILSIKDR